MVVRRRTRRRRFTLVLLVLTSVTVITLDFRGSGDGSFDSARSGLKGAFAPVQNLLGRAVSPVTNLFGAVGRYSGLRAENDRLRRELDEARSDALRGADAERERQLLLALSGLDFAAETPSVAARVVAYAPSNFQVTVEIDRGEGHRLKEGMPVVTEAGLVGRITDVSWDRATVLVLTDPSSAVGVRLAASGEVGVARGEGARRRLGLDFISVEAPVATGEVVVTSGLQGGLFPPQVPVGRVARAKVVPGALAQEVEVEPAVDLSRLQLVRVLLWTPG
ncbi:MAG: rod shape-determining protein MreC [Acidimicrobiales bacterium]